MAEQPILIPNALTNSNNPSNALRKRIILERRKSFPERSETIQHFAEHQHSSVHDIEEVSLCVCQQSKNFPLCDKTHDLFDLNIKPLVVGVPKRLLHDSISTKRPLSRSQNCLETHIPSSACGKNCSTCSETDGCSTKVEKITPAIASQQRSNTTQIHTSEQSILPEASSIVDQSHLSTSYSAHDEKLDSKSVELKTNSQTFSMQEVSRHCTKEDCWIVFYDKVYDVTPYFGFHPGTYCPHRH